METPNFICTKEEQKDVTHFFWLKVYQVSKMHRMMSVQYGKSVMSQRIVCQWSESFKNSHTSVKDGEGTGRQFTSITDADTGHTVENLKKLNFELLEHPLYNLDLTPSNSPV
jgi:hypothetical protein